MALKHYILLFVYIIQLCIRGLFWKPDAIAYADNFERVFFREIVNRCPVDIQHFGNIFDGISSVFTI